MRRLALLAAALVALVALVAASADAEDTRGTEFLDMSTPTEFFIGSTKAFDVVGPMKTKAVATVHEAIPDADHPAYRNGLFAIWARRCTPEKQKLVFRRQFFLAGPEYELGAAMNFFRGSNSLFSSGKLIVNGHRILKVGPGGGKFERTADRPKAFKFGWNEVKAVAVRKPNLDGKPCNVSKERYQYTGVVFSIFGELGSDVRLPPQLPEQEFRRLPEDSLGGGNWQLDFEVRNTGAGGLARVQLFITLNVGSTGEPHGTYLKVADPQPPVDSCKATPGFSEVHPRYVVCTIANLSPGAVATQHLEVAYFATPDDYPTPLYVSWSASGANEPPGSDSTDNKRSRTLWLCKYHSTDPRCPP